MRRPVLVSCMLLPLAACVQPHDIPPAPVGLPVAGQDQTARTQEQDRVARFRRLAAENDVVSPTVTETVLPAGKVASMPGPVSVLRVVFPERAFFAFDSATPLPESGPILDVIADNMKHDVPGAALTVLGHTDAVGTDAYNIDLSRRRAEAVMDALVARGVSPAQLTEVAIGKRQPIAPNDNPAGRALNRRVEFLVSPTTAANLAAVQQVVVPASYLTLAPADDVHAIPLAPSGDAPVDGAPVDDAPVDDAMVYGAGPTPIGALRLRPVAADQVTLTAPADGHAGLSAARPVRLAPARPARPVHLLKADDVRLRPVAPVGATGPNY